MPYSDWKKVKEIFESALSRSRGERSSFLDEACAGDHELRGEVDSLLLALGKAGSFLDSSALETKIAGMPLLSEGQTLNHYKIAQSVGEGGMGVVYLAKDTKLDRSVAIKILNEKFARSEDSIRRFTREAKAASALNHPNILTIFEIGESDGIHYIASEYVKGETLRNILKRERLDVARVIDIACQTASALEAAHKARIIHRDIKPENIIVREDGYVKVLDFGLAKLLADGDLQAADEDTKQRQNITATGMILGTVNYMSPEQATGKKVDERTDIFSLGAVLYEMLTGKAPFAGDSVPETFAKLIERDPEPIGAFISNVPDGMQQVVSRMLAKAPGSRYQSIAEAANDLKALNYVNLPPRTDTTPGQTDNRTLVMPHVTADGDASVESTFAKPQISLGAAPETVRSSASQENRGRSHYWATKAIVVLVAITLLIGGFFAFRYLQSSGKQIDSIAVMPFVNESGDPQVEYLSDGMTDTLISSLSELPNLKVKSRTSVFRYKGKEIDPKNIGEELGVQAIVNGRVTQRDGRTSVTLELVDTATEDVIFSTKYDKPQLELVTLQSDIARDVSSKLKSKLSGADAAKLTKTYTADPDALQLYLKGKFYTHKGGRDNVLQATDYFNKAIEKDPNYALAYAGLALNYDSYPLYNIAPPAEYEPKAKAAAIRAVELDDSLAEAHVALGKFQGEEREFRRAVELEPGNADVHRALSSFLTYAKSFDEAIAEGKKAQELDPSSAVIVTGLGATYAFARRYDEAIDVLRRAHEMDPTLYVPLGYLGFVQTLKGQNADAIATFRKAIEINKGAPNPKSHLAYALAKAGQREEALKVVEELKRQAAHEFISSFHFAIPYIALGDKDEAFFWLEKGVDEHSIGYGELSLHPWFDDLRSDPRFAALLKRTNSSRS